MKHPKSAGKKIAFIEKIASIWKNDAIWAVFVLKKLLNYF
jgi:hypothetical protein